MKRNGRKKKPFQRSAARRPRDFSRHLPNVTIDGENGSRFSMTPVKFVDHRGVMAACGKPASSQCLM